MADVSKALAFTLKNEGGYTNDPNDHGGPTNFGITQADYTQFLGRHATASDVQHMPLADATAIYKKRYWSVNSLDSIKSQSIATVIFDMGVLCGVFHGAVWAQSVCGVTPDGHIGSKSIAAINAFNVDKFVAKFSDIAQSYFNGIVARNSTQKKFLKGWTNRVNRLRVLHDAVPVTPVDIRVSQPKTDIPVSQLSYAGKLLKLGAMANTPHLVAHMMTLMGSHTPRYVTTFDVSKKATEKRLHLLDTKDMVVFSITCGVGSGSDPDNDGVATKFSDENGSHMTSLGVFRYAEKSHMSDGRPCVRLDGLESTNKHMRSRAILLHPAAYVTDSKAGQSSGCEAIAYNHVDWLEKLADGSFGIIGKEV